MAPRSDLQKYTESVRDCILHTFHLAPSREAIARTVETQTARKCFTHQLPLELILSIAEELRGTDLLCFSNTCRWFKSIPKTGPRMTVITLQDRKSFIARLKLEDYLALTAIEDPTQMTKTQLCRSCLTVHPVAAFASQDRRQPAFKRQCFGSSAKFRPCEHKSYSYSELHDLISRKNRFTCDQQNNTSQGSLCRGFLQAFRFPTRLSVDAYSSIQWTSFPSQEPIYWTAVLAQLQSTDAYLCPHMRTSNPALHKQLRCNRRKLTKPSRRLLPIAHDDPLFSSVGAISLTTARCDKAYCGTTVEIERFDKGNFLNLNTRRSLGDLKDATNSNWCAQLDVSWKRFGEGDFEALSS